MGTSCSRHDRSSRQLITHSPKRRPSPTHIRRVSTQGKERRVWIARNASGGVLGRRVRDGVPMTTFAPSVVAEPISSTVDLDAHVRNATEGERSTGLPSDVIPLLEPPSHAPMRMTRNHADDAEDLRQHTLACVINSDGCSSSAILDK